MSFGLADIGFEVQHAATDGDGDRKDEVQRAIQRSAVDHDRHAPAGLHDRGAAVLVEYHQRMMRLERRVVAANRR